MQVLGLWRVGGTGVALGAWGFRVRTDHRGYRVSVEFHRAARNVPRHGEVFARDSVVDLGA